MRNSNAAQSASVCRQFIDSHHTNWESEKSNIRHLIFAIALVSDVSYCIARGQTFQRCGYRATRPQFFSVHNFRCKLQSRIPDMMYRKRLTRVSATADIYGHTPYETWAISYCGCPYQSHQSGEGFGISTATIPSALNDLYVVGEIKFKGITQGVDLPACAELAHPLGGLASSLLSGSISPPGEHPLTGRHDRRTTIGGTDGQQLLDLAGKIDRLLMACSIFG